MASSNKQVLLLMATVACLASLASATQWVVGGKCRWRPMFNQTCWTAGKTFVVGDTLLFRYPRGMHTVVQVANEDDFEECDKAGNKLGAWSSGNDVVQLDRPGRQWFICTKRDHCLRGMKLAVDVVSAPPFQDPWPGTFPPPPRSPPRFRFPDRDDAPPPPPPFYGGAYPWAPPPPPPRSAAVRNPVAGAVSVAAAAAVVATALAF